MRSAKWFGWMPRGGRTRVLAAIEDSALAAALLFYRIPRVLMAPNTELVNLLAERTGKSTYLMKHGVDCATFRPRAHDPNAALRIGFVGRLSAEKHVRLLATVNNELVARGVPAEFVVIGEGVERAWLQRAMPAAQFRGVLEGEQLAREYGRLDLFAFPSSAWSGPGSRTTADQRPSSSTTCPDGSPRTTAHSSPPQWRSPAIARGWRGSDAARAPPRCGGRGTSSRTSSTASTETSCTRRRTIIRSGGVRRRIFAAALV